MALPQPQSTMQKQPEKLGETAYVPVGVRLRIERERRGEGLYDVADYLCIKPDFLHALELGHYERLPPHAYVMGFLRSYADYLGMDGHLLREQYRRELAGKPKAPQLHMPQPLPEGKTPHFLVILGSLLLAAAIYALWYLAVTGDKAAVIEKAPPAAIVAPPVYRQTAQIKPLTVPPLPKLVPWSSKAIAKAKKNAQTLAKAQAKAQALAAKEVAKEQAKGKTGALSIKATQKSWIMITDGKNNTVFSKTLEPGETYQVPDGGEYHLTTGNADGLVLTLGGKDLPPLQNRFGQEVRDLRLDPAVLSKP